MKDDHLSVRVPSALKAALEQLAEAEKRTLASYVHFVLHQHVESVSRKDVKSKKA